MYVIAGFRLPTGIETLQALLVRTADGDNADAEEKPFATLGKLDATLNALEDRGLLGWDRRANRYDLHPIVRGVTWSGLGDDAKADIYGTLQAHFEAMPKIDDWEKVESLEDLTPAIELYHTLIGLGRYDDAYVVFRDRLDHATLYRLSASRQRVEMLEWLFPDGLDALPRSSQPRMQSDALNALALGYQDSGQPGSAVSLFRRFNDISERHDIQKDLSVGLFNLSNALRLSGGLRSSDSSARAALIIDRERADQEGEAATVFMLGLALAVRGETDEAEAVLQRPCKSKLPSQAGLEPPSDHRMG